LGKNIRHLDGVFWLSSFVFWYSDKKSGFNWACFLRFVGSLLPVGSESSTLPSSLFKA
jgi:hypothetical protein